MLTQYFFYKNNIISCHIIRDKITTNKCIFINIFYTRSRQIVISKTIVHHYVWELKLLSGFTISVLFPLVFFIIPLGIKLSRRSSYNLISGLNIFSIYVILIFQIATYYFFLLPNLSKFLLSVPTVSLTLLSNDVTDEMSHQ